MATYTVKSGDSLSKIARDVLGDMSRWPEIAALNTLRAPYVIHPGQVLQLPGATRTPPAVRPLIPSIPVVPSMSQPVPVFMGPAGGGLATLIRSPKLWFALAAVAAWWFFAAKPRRPRRRRRR